MALTDSERRELRAYRKAANGYIPHIADDAKEVNDLSPILPVWVPGTMEHPIEHPLGELKTENGSPYKCTVAHTHSGEEGWNPASGSALWRRYHGTSPDTAWEFTADGANPYLTGEYCLENGAVYRCIAESSVYSPSTYPQHWEGA